ncbi:MAG: hypothetical protein ACR65O_16050 [Methylomicrobium sp.]
MIQFLADLNNSIEVIRTMQVFPFAKQTVLQLVVALLPLVPLLLTMISQEDLLKRLIELLLQSVLIRILTGNLVESHYRISGFDRECFNLILRADSDRRFSHSVLPISRKSPWSSF